MKIIDEELVQRFAYAIWSNVPGVDVEQMQRGDVSPLVRYWVWGPGALRIRWGTPGDLTRCHRLLRREVPRTSMTDNQIWGLCQNYHKRRFGVPNPRD